MDLLDSIRQRRSINYFEPGQMVPEDKLTELLETANLSPSSFNMQPWRVVVVQQPERKAALRKCAFDQPKVEEASAMLIMVADPAALEPNMPRVFDHWTDEGYMKAEMRPTYEGMAANLYGEADSLRRKLFAVKNTALFAMCLMITARGLGLQTHPMDGFDEAAVKKEFGIPDDKLIPMLVAVGTLKEGTKLLPRSFRRALAEFVSYETFM